jgi:hypothetical protein
MHREPLTDNQRAVYRFCQEHLEREGTFPTIRTIQGAFDLASTNGAYQYIEALRKKGYLAKRAGSYTFTDERLFVGPQRQAALSGLVDAVLHRLHLALGEAGHDADSAAAITSAHRTAFDNWMEGLARPAEASS